MLVLRVLRSSVRFPTPCEVLPNSLVLGLSEPQRQGSEQHRFQQRTIRSVEAGTLELHYETGRSAQGRVRPAELDAVVPKGMIFAYDVIAEVLWLRYVELKQRQRIRADLALRGVSISAGSVTNLSHLALGCLEQLHERAAGDLAESYRQHAFILHLDGTHEGGQWCHFVIREGMTGDVLLAQKIRSEHTEDIAGMLGRVKKLFGPPDVAVSDMSSSICKAVAKVLPETPHRLCHFHFLKAVGKTILGPDHDALGHSVRHVRSELLELRRDCVARLRQGDKLQEQVIALIDRVNVYVGELSGEGFPFDLPNLCYVQRCGEVFEKLELLLGQKRSDLLGGKDVHSHLLRLSQHLRTYGHSDGGGTTARLQRRNDLFVSLRDILHPTVGDTHAPLNWGRLGDPACVPDIDGKLAKISGTARRKARCKTLTASDRKMWKTLHRQLENHADKLVPLLEVRGSLYVLPRTNNLSETGFRDVKRKQRRTTGNGNLKRQLDLMPAQVFYVQNLASPHYRRLVFANRPLQECFAETDWDKVREAAQTMTTPHRLGAVNHALVNRHDFFDTVTAALAPNSSAGAGNRQ